MSTPSLPSTAEEQDDLALVGSWLESNQDALSGWLRDHASQVGHTILNFVQPLPYNNIDVAFFNKKALRKSTMLMNSYFDICQYICHDAYLIF